MIRQCTYLLLSFFLTANAFAVDIVQLALNDREISDYKADLIRLVMQKTEPEYGPYKLAIHLVNVNAERHLKELNSGELVNISFQLTTIEAEENAIAIKVPIDKGVRSYRLLLTHQNNVNKFSHVKTSDELKQLKAGMLYSWLTTSIIQHHGFSLYESPTFEGIFKLLSANRFDYTLRGVSEIYDEMTIFEAKKKNLVVVPNIALYINSPTYIFVSKHFPRLATRIQQGMEIILEDGSFDALISSYFDKYIKKSDLASRHVITIENPFIPNNTPSDIKHRYNIKK